MQSGRLSYRQGILWVLASLVYGLVSASLSSLLLARWGLYSGFFIWLALLVPGAWLVHERVRGWGVRGLCLLAAIAGYVLAMAYFIFRFVD